jgi:LysM repeat protein
MSKKNKPEEIPSWIRDLYKEDLDRVVRGDRPMYFRGMDDSPLRNVSPEFDILSGGAAVKGMNGIRSTLSPLNNGMGNYNFSIRGINKKIGELVDEAGLYLPEKLRPVYRTVVDAMSSSKDKGLGHITQPLANALYPADERRNRRLEGEHPVGYVDAIDGIWPREKYGLWGEKIERKADGGEMYTVSKGDTLWSIAKRLGLSLDDIVSWNRDIPDINKIQIGDKIKVSDPSLSIEKEDHDLMDIISREAEINKMSDEDIIKSVDHKSNYAIVDKKNKKLTVYSPSGDILYSTNNIGVDASGDDYNTYTKTTKDKKLIAGAGNMSTPAGITRVSGIGEYHGQKSFQRARFDPKTGKWDHDISSSMHHEASAGRGSNGCIRLLGNTGNELYNFIKKGDFIYTLPEKEGSRFVVREGSLNYIADNPYGEDSGEKRLWDDYNVHINKDFRPLNISVKNSDISPDILPKWIYNAYDSKNGVNSSNAFLGVISAIDNIAKMDKLGNIKEYSDAISYNKERIMSEFDIDSYTYDRMAMLAMGIAEQETKFGVSARYIGKQAIGDQGVDIAKRFRSLLNGNGWNDRSYNSKGITQIKIEGDNDETKKIYNKFGIDKENILKPYNSGIATMLRLASIYKNEVVGRGFKDNKGNDIDKFDALLYKWMGKGRLLNNGKASPDDNDYINNVKKYIGNFDFKVKYKDGGPIGDDPLYVRQDVSDKASYLKDILGNAIRRRLYENVTPDVVASNASLPDKVNEFIYGRNGKANVDEYSDQLWARFLSQPNNLDGNNKEIRIPDNVITDIEKMFNRDTKDEIKRLDKKIHDTEQEIYGSDKPATDDAYGRLKLLKKSREWVDVFEKNRNSVRSGKPTVFSEYDFYPEAAGDLTPLSGFGNFTIYRRPDGRLGVYDVYDFYSNDQEFPINIATKVLDAIGDKFEERGSFKDYNPAPESGKDALIRNAIMSKNKLEDKAEGGRINTGSDYGSGKYVIDPRRSENSKMAVYDEIWDYLTEKKGIPQTQAIGILSNIAAESGGDTEALGPAGDFGIQQWLGPRKKELQRRYGKKPTLTQQLDYLVDEYQGRVPGLGWNYINQGKFFDKDAQGNVYNYYMYSKADFDNATNYKDATVAWNQGYGRPLGSTLRNEKRLEFADMFSNRYGVPENEPMRYEFGQRDSGTGDGGQQPVPETVASSAPSLAPHPSMDSWWEKEGQDLLYKMLAQSGANKKAIEDIANNIKNDPQSEAQIAEAERMRKEQAKRQLVLNMIPGLMLNIKGMSSTKSEGGPVGDNRWFYDEVRRKQVIDKQNTMQSLSEEKHKILRSSRLALEQGFIDEDQFRRINNLPVFKLSDDVKYDGRNNREVDLINSLFDTAMYDSFGKSVKEQSVEEEKNRKERFYPYKLMADSLLTIGDIATASPGFLRLIERSGARLYPLLNNIAHSNSIQKISGLSGIGVDSSQIALDPDDDNLWNILGVAGAAAELIGGTDILRNTSVMGRIGNRLDDILDIANPVVTLGGLADDVLN